MKMKIKILILAAAATMTGCAQVATSEKVVVSVAKKAITVYCSAPKAARLANRLMVSKAVAPNSIKIECK